MLTRQDIRDYHLRLSSSDPHAPALMGFELELIPFQGDTLQRLPYSNSTESVTVERLLSHLVEHEGFVPLEMNKTFGIGKQSAKITLEPGAQVEFGSPPRESVGELIQDLHNYLKLLQQLTSIFGVQWLNVSYDPINSLANIATLPNPRYQLMEESYERSGKYGKHIMKLSANLQISINYANESQLEEQMRRLLLLKPLLLCLSANSRMVEGVDSGFRSFRIYAYESVDASRTGTPGTEAIWQTEQWKLDHYIDKVLAAPLMFELGADSYKRSSLKPFSAYLDTATLDDYVFHLSTFFVDIRIRQYSEIRYLDQPGIGSIPGFLLLLRDLLENEEAWNSLVASLPYRFSDVPMLTPFLNTITPDSNLYWEQLLKQPVINYLVNLQKRLPSPHARYIAPLLEKARTIASEKLPDLRRSVITLDPYVKE